MNNLTGLIPILYAALQVVSRELVGIIPAVSRDFRADNVAVSQSVRVPITPPNVTRDIIPGARPSASGQNFDYVDITISKEKAVDIWWTGNEEISVGGQLNGILMNQYAQGMRAIVNEVEKDICAEAVAGAIAAGHIHGTAGTTPFATNLSDFAQCLKKLDDNGAPKFQRQAVLNTTAAAALRTLEKLSNVNQAGTPDLLRQGVIGDIMGFAVRESAGLVVTEIETDTDPVDTLPNVLFTPDFIYAAMRPPAMPKAGDEAKDIMIITDPVSNLSFQVALYPDYKRNRIEIGLAWGQKVVNKDHGLVLLG
jgi:hypothetical protein